MVKIVVDDAFMEAFNKAFGSKIGDPNYNIMFDANQDGVIDMLDAIWFSHYYGQEIDLPWIEPTKPVELVESTAEVSNPEHTEFLAGLYDALKTLKTAEMEYWAKLISDLRSQLATLPSGVGAGGVTPIAYVKQAKTSEMEAQFEFSIKVLKWVVEPVPLLPEETEA